MKCYCEVLDLLCRVDRCCDVQTGRVEFSSEIHTQLHLPYICIFDGNG